MLYIVQFEDKPDMGEAAGQAVQVAIEFSTV